MSRRATGSFEVKLNPQQPADEIAAANLGRMSIVKRFSGDLQASSLGEMLAVRTATEGSAGYVALERVTGTLDGREGEFVLQHLGIMDRGARRLQVSVVPDSGTGRLAGITGAMNIRIENGRHDYDFDYALPESAD
jgi:hypothetical protein